MSAPKRTELSQYDLSSGVDRYRARMAGFRVPLMQGGGASPRWQASRRMKDRKRPRYSCRLCGGLGHTAPTCPLHVPSDEYDGAKLTRCRLGCLAGPRALVMLLEVKPPRPPSARKLTARETETLGLFGGSYAVVSTVDEALLAMGFRVLP